MGKMRRFGGEGRRGFLVSFAGLSLLALSGCGGGGAAVNDPATPTTGTARYSVRVLDVPGSGGWIFPRAFNGSGQLAGYTLGAGQELNAFFHDGSQVHEIRAPQGSRVSPQAVNDAGRVAGLYRDASGATRAFVWSLADGFEPVFDDPGTSESRALALNGRGSVGGFGQRSGQAGLLAVAGEADTRDLLAQADIVAVHDLNDRDQVVGRTAGGSVLWSPADGATPIGAPGVQVVATSLNERGEVAGIRPTPGGSVPFHWSAAGGMTDLSGDESYRWTLVDIDEEGRIAGYASQALAGGGEHDRPFVWSRAAGLRYIDVPGGRSARVIALNDRGEVAGYFIDAGADRGFAWSAGQGFTDLGASLSNAPAGLVVRQATAIAADGTVAGISNQGPVLLTPLP